MRSIVVGGGIIGLFSALELSAAGSEVILLERGRVGAEATGAAGGILSPLPPGDAPAPLEALVRHSCERYAAMAVQNIGYQQCGLEIRTEGRWFPEIACLEPRALMVELVRAARTSGIEMRESVAVTALATEGARVSGVRTADGALSADAVVVAGGAWSGSLVGSFGPDFGIRPVRGQMLALRAPPGTLSHIVLEGESYLIPRLDGTIVVGSTVEEVGFDRTTTPDALAALRATAIRLVPALADAAIEASWAGLRPASARALPLIGTHPYMAGVFLNTGHFRNGICLAPASGRLLADLVTGRPPFTDAAPFRPGHD